MRCVHLVFCMQTKSCQIHLIMRYLISIYWFHHTSEWRKHVSYETAGRTMDKEGTWEKSPISIIEGHFHHARGTFPFSDLTIQKRGSYLRERIVKMENLTFRLYITKNRVFIFFFQYWFQRNGMYYKLLKVQISRKWHKHHMSNTDTEKFHYLLWFNTYIQFYDSHT